MHIKNGQNFVYSHEQSAPAVYKTGSSYKMHQASGPFMHALLSVACIFIAMIRSTRWILECKEGLVFFKEVVHTWKV